MTDRLLACLPALRCWLCVDLADMALFFFYFPLLYDERVVLGFALLCTKSELQRWMTWTGSRTRWIGLAAHLGGYLNAGCVAGEDGPTETEGYAT